MREIKFRAWDGKQMIEELDCPVLKPIGLLNENHKLVFGHDGHDDYVYEGDVEDFKLMQFTGLKDKEGKEIYEGDKIIFPNIKKNSSAIISFGKHTDIAEAGCTTHSNYGFYLQFDDGSTVGLLNEESFLDWKNIEVIGNIYQDPELIKKDLPKD